MSILRSVTLYKCFSQVSKFNCIAQYKRSWAMCTYRNMYRCKKLLRIRVVLALYTVRKLFLRCTGHNIFRFARVRCTVMHSTYCALHSGTWAEIPTNDGAKCIVNGLPIILYARTKKLELKCTDTWDNLYRRGKVSDAAYGRGFRWLMEPAACICITVPALWPCISGQRAKLRHHRRGENIGYLRRDGESYWFAYKRVWQCEHYSESVQKGTELV